MTVNGPSLQVRLTLQAAEKFAAFLQFPHCAIVGTEWVLNLVFHKVRLE